MEWQKSDFGYYLKLVKGEEVVQSLTEFASEHGMESGAFSGIGAFRDISVGYFNTKTQDYPVREFPGTHKVLSCKGNFALKDGAPFPHCHILFSDVHYQAYGGHLLEATVEVTGEFSVFTSTNEIHRVLDKDIGLDLWDI